jgi:hypothetical protein
LCLAHSESLLTSSSVPPPFFIPVESSE